MELGQISCAQSQAATPVPAPDAPIQLQIPSMPALPAPRRRTRHRKAFWIPVHLMFGIEDDDFTALDEHAYPPVLYTHDGTTLHPATERDIFTSAEALLLRRFRRGVPIAHYPRLLKRMLHPSGRAEPTEWDVGCAKRLRYTFQKIDMLLVDYVVVGKTMTSLAEQGCFRPEAMRMYM